MQKNIINLLISLIIFPFNNYLFASELINSDGKSEYQFVDNSVNKPNINFEENEIAYVLGPGDILTIKILGLEEMSGDHIVGLDGYINLIDVGQVKASDFTVEELESFLQKKYINFVKNPVISITILEYKPIKIFVSGEVKKPGLYDFSINLGRKALETRGANTANTPTLYDALRAAGGITQYSDLTKIKVIRKTSNYSGGETFEANINLFNLFLEGDQSLNINLFDKDTIIVAKSQTILKEQFAQIANSNLEPNTIKVFVSGNVKSPGMLTMPNNSSLTQAIAMAGGIKNLSGNISFLRFDKKGKLEKRTFYHKVSQEKKINSYKNPRLISGDIVHVDKSLVGKSAEFIGTISSPIGNAYGIYKIFGGD